MLALYISLFIPTFGAIIMAVIGQHRQAGIINICLSSATLLTTFFLTLTFLHSPSLLSKHQQFYIDAFSMLLIILTAIITTTTAIFSNRYMWQKVIANLISKKQLRLYHVMYQIFIFMILVTLTTNNIGILWVAMEGSTLATVLLVSLYRTPHAIEAAWKYFILSIVGIALALFGIILLYSSAAQLFAANNSAILWTFLSKNAGVLDEQIVKLAFAFLLVGYGVKMGLVPLNNWLPDAYSESPAPVTALLSGLLSTAALYALIRFKIIVDLALNSHLAGYLMMGFGMLSFLIAAVLIHRQKNIKRLFSYSSIEHMGLITFGFGLGGTLATFSAIFYILMHSFIKSAIFINIGNIAASNQPPNALIRRQPFIGWCLMLATLAICGLPPFGIFTSELLLFIATIKSFPWLAMLLILGLVIAFSGLLRNIHAVIYGDGNDYLSSPLPSPSSTMSKKYFSYVGADPCVCPKIALTGAHAGAPLHSSLPRKLESITLPIIIHLSLAITLGIYIPPILSQLLEQATTIITGGI